MVWIIGDVDTVLVFCQGTLYTTRELASWVGVSKAMDLKNDMNGFDYE
jgi:hypothetical protein